MTAFIPIEAGQFVLAYQEQFCPAALEGDLAGALQRLVDGGSGWDCLHDARQQFEVLSVEKVSPKTYVPIGERRRHRYLVVAAGERGEMLALRDKLFGIGFAADRAIREETDRRMADFVAETRGDALHKVHAALPHIFGRGEAAE